MIAPGLLLVFTFVWVALTGSVSPGNIVLGLAISALCLWLLRHELAKPAIRPTWGVFPLFLSFLKELAISAYTVARTVLSPRMPIDPALIEYPLRLTRDFEITLLSNLITLTPGTMTVDVSTDRKTLLIHVLDASDPEAVIASIRNGFERQIGEAFRP